MLMLKSRTRTDNVRLLLEKRGQSSVAPEPEYECPPQEDVSYYLPDEEQCDKYLECNIKVELQTIHRQQSELLVGAFSVIVKTYCCRWIVCSSNQGRAAGASLPGRLRVRHQPGEVRLPRQGELHRPAPAT